jgi:rare lipoprotein A
LSATVSGVFDLAQCRRTSATPTPKSIRNFRWNSDGRKPVPQQNVGVMAEYRHRIGRGASRLQFAALALALTSSHAYADTFQEMWMGRIARPPADDQEASVYWEDKWDARGKRFKANEVSCAHRTEAFGTIFVVTNLENGKKIRCPVQDRGPFTRGRVLDFSLGAARQIGCDGLCRVTVRRAGYE